jgi:hypothetical protein
LRENIRQPQLGLVSNEFHAVRDAELGRHDLQRFPHLPISDQHGVERMSP